MIMTENQDVFGEVIHRYTRQQAIEDGILVDVTVDACEAGFKYPVSVTEGVWSKYVKVPVHVQGQDERGRLWDILWMCRYAIAKSSGSEEELYFKLHVRNDNRPCDPPLVTL